MKRNLFWLAIVLLAAAVYFGLLVTVADQYLGADLSLGLPVVARTLIAFLGGLVALVLIIVADDFGNLKRPKTLAAAGILFLLIGSYFGLFVAPPEQFMGETQRIMYVHVPTAWFALVAMTLALASAVVFLFGGDYDWDARMEASIEVGVVLAFLLCCQGAIWAKPTWGVWWDWDPRLTTTAVLLFAFLGILALRKFSEEPHKRAMWSAVATIIAYVDVPIVYFSVKWWNSLHQQQSNPNTVSKPFWIPLRANAFGILLLMTAFIMLRARVAALRLKHELAPPPALTDAEMGETV
ncbi:MAG TPA: cytochrome c biogenesis protein CcsA [Thermoanaerobaculia bacterium]|jgi:heme exporter protein C|nr:cytochrome c biogenesis protein CcsA [Thermoanaerobaculia bacterium]